MSIEDEEDLPSILFKDNSKKSGDFCMPSADILASQRAREEQCVQELQQLCSFEKRDYVCLNKGRLMRQTSDSSGSESEASLTAAVEALCVEQPVHHNVLAPSPTTLLRSMLCAPILQPYDLSLLKYTAFLIDTNDEQLISNSLNQIVLDTRQCIKRWNRSDNLLQDEDTVVLCCWLCASCIWSGHRPCGAHVLLSELLKRAAPIVVKTVASALSTTLEGPRALVEASDAVWGYTWAQRCIACSLLAAAINALAPSSSPVLSTSPALSITDICGRLQSVWRDLNAEERHAALLVAGRVAIRIESDPGGLEALRDLLSLSVQAPGQPLRQAPDHLRILVAASRLQLLFEVNNIPTRNCI